MADIDRYAGVKISDVKYIGETIKITDKFSHTVTLQCAYDPQGLCCKIFHERSDKLIISQSDKTDTTSNDDDHIRDNIVAADVGENDVEKKYDVSNGCIDESPNNDVSPLNSNSSINNSGSNNSLNKTQPHNQNLNMRGSVIASNNKINENVINTNNSSSNILFDFILTEKTNNCQMFSKGHLIILDDEIIHLMFGSESDAVNFRQQLDKLCQSVFTLRTDHASATQYFLFYSYLSQQQNMLQDVVRTSTYQKAIHGNLNDFYNKTVLDVGTGSGILSFFAVQAGAKKVFAVEASNMATYAQQLVEDNNLADRIIVIAGKIEEINLPEKVDIIVSEPMGYMLFNERMLETYLHAKKWLKPGGKMYPSRGDLHIAPFSDEALFMEQYNKSNFWYQTNFYQVDLSSMKRAAMEEYFRQPIVDTFDIRICLSKSVCYSVDFQTANEQDLYRMHIPLRFEIFETGSCHGLAFWFDVEFAGSTISTWLSTSPTEPLTHWYQVRCLLLKPIFVKRGQVLVGDVLLVANKRQSYDVTINLSLENTEIKSSNTLDLKNPYFRYTGAPAAVPVGSSTTSPTESYWSQLDLNNVAQRNTATVPTGTGNDIGVNEITVASIPTNNLVNGITVNGINDLQLASAVGGNGDVLLVDSNGGIVVGGLTHPHHQHHGHHHQHHNTSDLGVTQHSHSHVQQQQQQQHQLPQQQHHHTQHHLTTTVPVVNSHLHQTIDMQSAATTMLTPNQILSLGNYNLG